MKKALITGSKGFVAKHLDEFLSKKDLDIYYADLPETDLVNIQCVDELIYTIKPDYIFHLAAKAFVPTSFKDPQDVLMNNIIPAVNIFEAVRKYGLNTKILCAGSSEEYGLVKPEETPIKETNKLRPQSPYAISKITMDMLCRWYAKTYNMHIICTRAFNHSGAGRPESYMTSAFAKQIAQLEKGKDYWTPVYNTATEKLEYSPKIKVGNLEAKRDITDVRDMVVAYWLAINKCIPGEVYNISSGKAYSCEEILSRLISMSKIKEEIPVEQDSSKMRPSDVPLLLGDNTKFIKQTGWKPKYNIDDTLKSVLDYWRKNV